MQNIFLQTYRKNESSVFITGEDYHYLKNVRRVAEGDIIDAVFGDTKARLFVSGIDNNSIICSVVEARPISGPGSVTLVVYQGLLKARKMDFLVARLAELGVRCFVPLVTSRSIPRGDTGAARIERWRRLSREGAKISGAETMMEVRQPTGFAEACSSLNNKKNGSIIIFCVDCQATHIRSYLDSISEDVGVFFLFFGPEGGFTEEEVNTIKAIGGAALTMGPFIMKSDTAALVGTGFIRIYYSKEDRTQRMDDE